MGIEPQVPEQKDDKGVFEILLNNKKLSMKKFGKFFITIFNFFMKNFLRCL